MNLLGLSGSLRQASLNTAALEAARRLAPAGTCVTISNAIGGLPHFNADRDEAGPPAEVEAFRAAIGACDGLLIACPEYAHGMPGAFKNALDWLVSSPEFPGKPVALINTSPRAFHAQASVREVLTTMAARLVPEAFVSLPLLGHVHNAATIVADHDLAAALTLGLDRFALAISAK
ncbi:MAG: NADPH-dependent FMN reductase [Phreatobacter sp.]